MLSQYVCPEDIGEVTTVIALYSLGMCCFRVRVCQFLGCLSKTVSGRPPFGVCTGLCVPDAVTMIRALGVRYGVKKWKSDA